MKSALQRFTAVCPVFILILLFGSAYSPSAEGQAMLVAAEGAGSSSTDALPSAPAPSPEALAKVGGALNLAQQPSSSSSAQSATPAPSQQQEQQTKPDSPEQQKQQPANPSAPSLSDLGLTPSQTAPDPALQARLDRHTQMLKIHQRLGLITLVPLAATLISSGGAGAEHHNGAQVSGGNTAGRDLHAALGAVSVGMYGATAYYAIRAPKVSEGPARGGIKLHKYLIYVHAPGMVLTPILGAMAFNQLNNGEKVHGIASAHAAVAWTTVLSYSAAVLAVSWPIHL